MPRKSSLTPAQLSLIRNAPRSVSVRELARTVGASPAAVHRALSKVRTADEFGPPPRARFEGSASISPPRKVKGGSSWTIESIRKARDALMAGDFGPAVALARATHTDDAIFVPRQNRIDAVNAIKATLVGVESTRGEIVRKKCETLVSIPRSEISVCHRNMVDLGVGIGFIEREASPDGASVSMSVSAWPMDDVKWNEHARTLETRTDDGQTIPITHGDGTWIVFRKSRAYPWIEDACLLVTALIYASHAEALRSWNASTDSHGLAKILGELPEGVSLQTAAEDGSLQLSPEARAFLDMLADVASGEVAAGLRPAGAKVDYLERDSTAWQIFAELINGREKAAARVYLGTDAILGSVGGAPGVDISALFGVASTKLQGDFEAIEQALASGLYAPWTAINFGDSKLAPRLRYELPDPDADRKSAEEAAKRERLASTLASMREQQFEINQDVVDRLCREFGIASPPQLAAAEAAAIPLTLAPTDLAKVVRVREARASQGLAPFGDARDDMTITEFDAYLAAKAAAPAPPAP